MQESPLETPDLTPSRWVKMQESSLLDLDLIPYRRVNMQESPGDTPAQSSKG